MIVLSRRLAPRRIALVLAVFLSLSLGASPARSAALSWTGATSGDWSVASNWSPAQVPTAVDDVTIDVNATVTVGGAATATFNSLVLGDAAGSQTPTLEISGAASSAGQVTINSGATLLQNTTSLLTFRRIGVLAGGRITHSPNSSARAAIVNLSVSGDFSLASGAAISVDGSGYAGGGLKSAGFGPGGGGTGSSNNGGGGGHGGAGAFGTGGSPGGPPYDDTTNPIDLGSGGGGDAHNGGGAGGGEINLRIGGMLALNGTMSANGVSGGGSNFFMDGGGGGSGGTINITAAGMTGAGSLTANGGAGTPYGGAPGGAGRISIAVTASDSSALQIHADPILAAGATGGQGTIAIQEPGAAGYELTIGDNSISRQAVTEVLGASPSFVGATLMNSDVAFDTGSILSISSISVIGQTRVLAGTLSFAPGGAIEVRSGGLLQFDAAGVSGAALFVRNTGVFETMNANRLDFTSVEVDSSGKLTHAANAATKSSFLDLTIEGDFIVQSGGLVSSDGLGYSGGGLNQPGNGSGGGGTGSTNNGGGAGHGGLGAAGAGGSPGGAAYDDLTNPTDLGSGGGGDAHNGGGAGGGEIALRVGGTLTVNGTLSANGVPGGSSNFYMDGGGSGSGGTINVTATNLAGSGVVRANGGPPAPYGGAPGAGGRVAVVVSGSDGSTIQYQADPPGLGGATAGEGVIATRGPGAAAYSLSVGSPSVLRQAPTPISGASLTLGAVTLNNSVVAFDTGSTVNLGSLVVNGAAALSGADLVFVPGGTIKVRAGGVLALSAPGTSGGNLVVRKGGIFQQASVPPLNFTSVEIDTGGKLTHAPNSSGVSSELALNVSGDFNLQSGASINADGLGFAGGGVRTVGFGPGGGSGTSTNIGAGGGHGGAGGVGGGGSSGGGIYDEMMSPADFGSGGGGDSHNGGGAGGGAIVLQVAGTLTLNGAVSANGVSGGGSSWFMDGGGGGGGGTVNIAAGTLTGSGTLGANGGAGTPYGGAGGGGGIIALSYATKTGSPAYSVLGGGGTGPGSPGIVFDNGHLSGFNASASTTSLSQMQAQLTSNQNLSETVSAQSLDFTGAVSTGSPMGTFTRAILHLVTVQTGSFAGKGFFTGAWSLTLPSGDSLSGQWQGTATSDSASRQMRLNGSMEAGIRGILSGVLTESVAGSGNFDRLAVNCRVIQEGGQTGATDLYFTGSSQTPQTVQYPGTPLSLLQASITGQVSGYAAGALETTFTLLRIASPGNPYDGQGFFLPTYSAAAGAGVGWAYAATTPAQSVRLYGYLDQPLFGLFNGWLVTTSPQSLLMTLDKADIGLPIQPLLSIFTTYPHIFNTGELETYEITVRNDGYASAPGLSLVAESSEWADFVSASGDYTVYQQGSWWNNTGALYRKPFVRWDIPVVPPRASLTFTYQTRVRLPVASGPQPHNLLNGGEVQLVSTDYANQVFANVSPGLIP